MNLENFDPDYFETILGVFIFGIKILITYYDSSKSSKEKKKKSEEDVDGESSHSINTHNHPQSSSNLEHVNESSHPPNIEGCHNTVHNNQCEYYRENMEKHFQLMLKSELLELKLELQRFILEEINRPNNRHSNDMRNYNISSDDLEILVKLLERKTKDKDSNSGK